MNSDVSSAAVTLAHQALKDVRPDGVLFYTLPLGCFSFEELHKIINLVADPPEGRVVDCFNHTPPLKLLVANLQGQVKAQADTIEGLAHKCRIKGIAISRLSDRNLALGRNLDVQHNQVDNLLSSARSAAEELQKTCEERDTLREQNAALLAADTGGKEETCKKKFQDLGVQGCKGTESSKYVLKPEDRVKYVGRSPFFANSMGTVKRLYPEGASVKWDNVEFPLFAKDKNLERLQDDE